MKRVVTLITLLLLAVCAVHAQNPEPAGWYSGDMHAHRSCGGSPESVSSMFSRMTPENLAVTSLLADSGNAEVQNATTDLPLVNGQDASVSTPGHILHWDSEWHWDATYSQYAHQALGGHIVNLGLTSAQQLWQEYTFPILDWAHQHNGIAGFAHMQYLDGNGLPNSLTCCTPIEFPVEVALGAADFISEDVDDVQIGSGSGMYSETPIQAYYKLLNSGFRPGLAAGTDYPCNGGDDGGALGALLTYVQMPGNGPLSYANWVQGIANGRTVVSRNGHKEFLALTVNGTSTPGDEIDLSAAGNVSVTVKWTASQNYSGTIELVQNGTVVGSFPASVTASTPATYTTTVNITKSGWLAARRMGTNPLTNAYEHYLQTGAVFVIVGGAPIRASQADANYFVNWTTGLITNTNAGGQWNSYFPTSLTQAQARYKAAQAMFQQIASEAAGTGSALTSIAITPTNKIVAVGSQTPFGATGTYANGTSLNLTGQVRWSSSNPAVATINTRGLVSALAAGGAVITASMGSVTTSTGITVGANPLTISTASLPNGTVGVQYTGAMTATGGTTPYTWSVTGGALPTGLTLNTTTGAITGSPTAAGTFTPTIQVVDTSTPAQAVSQGYTIVVSAAIGSGPYSIWPSTAVPGTADAGSDSAVELGVQFRSDVPGNITGVRFYKSAANIGTHTGSLWSSTGTRLATATFSGETASGWQQVNFATPVAITAGTTYVASYHLTTGHYADDQQYFATSGVDNPPLHALMNGSGGAINGVYAYGSGTFPNSTWNSSNYWVDVVFTSGTVNVPPTVTSVTPAAGAINVDPQSAVSAIFSEGLDATTVNTSSVQLLNSAGTAIQATVSYNASNSTVTLTPVSALANSATYTAVLKGGLIKDLTGLALAADYTWTFTTIGSAPPPSNDGPGGPILIVSSSSNPFSRYFTEILRNEGLNEFLAMDISQVTATTLNSYDVVILGNIPLTSAQVSMFTSWVNNGGNLIAMRPDPQLASLLGLSSTGNVLPDAYLLMNTTSGPGAGLVNQTIQYHGNADLYVANGATVLATLYSNANTATSNPALTLNKVGLGQAAAFTFDLARSVVYTRQGNPAWASEPRDGQGGPMRSDDLFFGGASFDPQPDYVDRSKIAIPQADEEQRLLANLIIQMDLGKRPLPRFWYFPGSYQAAVIMTDDDHGDMYGGGATATRFAHYRALSPANCSTANWTCVRATAYLIAPNIAGNPLTNSQASTLVSQGFEIGAHMDSVPDCSDWTPTQLASFYSTQLASFQSVYTSVPAQKTHRMHCIGWSDYDSQPQVELQNGIRFDTNYYYWPPEWVNDTPGLFTGSGMPMRFTLHDGTLLDVYQATTQMTDESSQTYPNTITALLNNAVGPNGYYGFFTANMHNDDATSDGADAIIASAQSLGVPVISAAQALTWLDGRNGSSFTSLSWNGSVLSFGISVATGATNLQAMLPVGTTAGTLGSIKRGTTAVSFGVQTIKGMMYAVFPATAGSYTATYVTGPVLAKSLTLSPTSVTGGATSTATLTFNAVAPAGTVVTLASNNPAAATVPATITLAAASLTATFPVTSLPVATATTVSISATLTSTASANLTVNPPTLSSVALSPTSLVGGPGYTSTGTVTLNGPAPSAGMTVTLSSNNTVVATVPANVVVASGATTATFTVATTLVAANTSVTITATLGSTSRTARLTVTPPPALSTFTLSPASLVGGNTSTGTVTLTLAAQTGGFVVNLSSANPTVATVPASVTVAAGSTSATFAVTTTAVTAQTPVVITASAGTVTPTATLTVNPPSLTTLSRSPSSVIGGVSSTGTVTLSGIAPVGDFLVTLTSANPAAASVPATVTVPAGTTSATFTIATTPVTAATPVVITATAGTVNLTTTLTVNPPTFTSIALSPTSVVGGVSSTGTLTLSGMAPAGAVITLTSNNTAAATVPASVTFVAGATTATFPITTNAVTASTRVTISATFGTVTRTARLTVNPPALSTLALNPTSVKGGTASTGTVTLTGPAGPSGMVLSLSSSSGYATVPDTVTVPAGTSTATFNVNTSTTTRNRTPTISATDGTVTRSAILTITP